MKIGGKTKRKKKLHRHLSLKSFVRKTWLKRFGIHRGFVGRSAPPLAGGWVGGIEGIDGGDSRIRKMSEQQWRPPDGGTQRETIMEMSD